MPPDGPRRVFPPQHKINKALGVLHAIADIVALGLPGQGIRGALMGQQVHCVGELNLATDTIRCLVNAGKDVRLEDVSAGNRQVAGSIIHRRFLDQLVEPVQVRVTVLGRAVDDAVAADPFFWNMLHGDNTAMCYFVCIHELAKSGWPPGRRVDDRVTKQHRKWLVADVTAPDADRVSETTLHFLTNIEDAGLIAHIADLVDQMALVGFVKVRLQFWVVVEVVLDRAFAAARDDG